LGRRSPVMDIAAIETASLPETVSLDPATVR
jgi:hypothetical protein